jgi:hypothetical protein
VFVVTTSKLIVDVIESHDVKLLLNIFNVVDDAVEYDDSNVKAVPNRTAIATLALFAFVFVIFVASNNRRPPLLLDDVPLIMRILPVTVK